MDRENHVELRIPPHLTMPDPQDYGLPVDLTADECKANILKLENRASNLTGGVAYIVALFGILYLFPPANGLSWVSSDWSRSDSWLGLAGPAWIALIGSLFLKVALDRFRKRYLSDPASPNTQKFWAAVVDFETRVIDWNDRQTEAGLSYWKNMRGVAFEFAIRDFLTRRGCETEMTKGSGDGGIDLVVRMGSSTFWCQCKGHASPISVAVIREIAGVCSRGGGRPVVIAVNGYTNSAIATANKLRVQLIDAHDLTHMARKPNLTYWMK